MELRGGRVGGYSWGLRGERGKWGAEDEGAWERGRTRVESEARRTFMRGVTEAAREGSTLTSRSRRDRVLVGKARGSVGGEEGWGRKGRRTRD